MYQNVKGDYELFKMAKKKTCLPHLLETKVFTFTIPFTVFNISDAILKTQIQQMFCPRNFVRFLERPRFSQSNFPEGDWDPPKPPIDSWAAKAMHISHTFPGLVTSSQRAINHDLAAINTR